MAQKKIDDVKRPDKVTPSSSSRPIIVTNRPVIANDPMVVAPEEADKKPATAPLVRTGKTIKPVSADLQVPSEPTEEMAEKTEPEPVAAAAESKVEAPEEPAEEHNAEPAAEELESEEPKRAPAIRNRLPDTAAQGPGAMRDAEAATTAAAAEADAAKQAREAELEALIASGKYAVPINAVHRRRSRLILWTVCLLFVLLAGGLLALHFLDNSALPAQLQF